MKAAAATTARLTELVCQLPGVAVLEWCDRAAMILSRLHTPSGAMVAVGQFDRRGTVLHIESTGAAWCGESDENKPTAGAPASPVHLQSIRESVVAGEWIGWDPRSASMGETIVAAMRPTPAVSRRLATGLNKRWDGLASSEVIVALTPLAGPIPDRLLIAEVAMVNRSAEELTRDQIVISTLLPMIGARYRNAIGEQPADRHTWLTPREEAILWKLVSGKKVPAIAAELHRSIYTVHDHVKSLHRKLGASNRGQLVARALGHLGPLIAKANEGAPPVEAEADDDDHPVARTPVPPAVMSPTQRRSATAG